MSSAAAPRDAGRPGGWMIAVGALLLVLALGGGAVAAVAGFRAVDTAAPTAINERAVVAVAVGEEFAIYSRDSVEQAGSCTVTGPGGQDVPTQGIFGTEELTVNGQRWVVARTFVARVAGDHEVSCAGTGLGVGPRVPVFRTVGLVLAGVFGGIVIGGAGLLLLIFGFIRRRPPKPTTPAPPGAQPPGPWGPFPSG